ncbi:competence damage-inducible protein A [Candidatus Bathyarchaeota archaeon]|nr:competence damage-inducible protein A [Candidatus Bathyarchaeota archaeon]
MTQEMEIISVGNELLIGKVLNTNAEWLSKRATNLGITVKRVTVVPDDVDETALVIRETLKRKPQFVVTTGGLGPTFDDKTLEIIAKAFRCKLVVNQVAVKMVKKKYQTHASKKGRDCAKLTTPQVKMATIPENAKPIPNPVGAAPAIRIDFNGTVLIALPGVPQEMEAIFEENVAPLLKSASRGNRFYEESLYFDGIMESELAPLIDKVMQDNPGIYVKSHPRGTEKKPHMEIHFSLTSPDHETAQERIHKAVTQITDLITRLLSPSHFTKAYETN